MKRNEPIHISVADSRFVPYTLEDVAVIIPHCSCMPKRWVWFWPRYLETTPDIVVKNTIVVYDNCNGRNQIPAAMIDMQKTSHLAVLSPGICSFVQCTKIGLEHLPHRLIVRVANDIELAVGWVEAALAEFNREPHVKILAQEVGDAPPYSWFEERGYTKLSWQRKFLRHGDYKNMSFFMGAMVIANRIIWWGYYPQVIQATDFEGEDFLFSFFSRADNIPMVNFGDFFSHRGVRGQDRIE